MKKIFGFIVLFFCLTKAFSQIGYPSRNNEHYWDIRDSLDNLYDKHESQLQKEVRFEITTDYMSKVVYRGRNFGTDQWGINPQLYCYFGNGFYVNYNNYYWAGLPNKWAKVDLGLGYEGELGKHFSYSLGYERWWFRNGDKTEINNIKNFTDVSLSYYSDYLAVDVSNYYMWGKDYFWINSAEVSHDFGLWQWSPGYRIGIAPKASIIYGTNNHTTLFYQDLNPFLKQTTRYELQDMEFEIPITISLGHLSITPSIHRAFPQNPGDDDPYTLPPFTYYTLQFKYIFYTGIVLNKNHAK